MKKLIIAVIFISCSLAHSAELELCKVIRIIDGDTIEVIYRNEKEKVRFYGIDTPERKEPGFKEATEFTRQALQDKYIYLSFPAKHKRDHFGRLLANIFIDGNFLFNKALVEKGYAKLYRSTTLDELTYYEYNQPQNFDLTIESIILNNDIKLLNYIFNPKNKIINKKEKTKLLKSTFVLAAKTSNSPAMIKAIVNLGVDINFKIKDGVTPLHIAASLNPNKSIIESMINLGADINAKTKNGYTPLDLATNSHNAQIISLLQTY